MARFPDPRSSRTGVILSVCLAHVPCRRCRPDAYPLTVVNVKNSLDYAGTAIHFHGIRQNHTFGQDGVASISQCPIPGDGQTQTYTWVATQYGTSWYHSHYAVQAWDGLFGAIVIRGPASAQYHEENDLGAVMLGDWTHQTADSLLETANVGGGTVGLANGLINGTNTYKTGENTTVGKRFELAFEKDKLHRIRFVNTAIDTMYNLYFDDHEMQVISADFVAIEPFTTKNLSIAIGQRYDVIVKGSGSALKSWFRAVPKQYCGGQLEPGQDVRGIVRYKGAEPGNPAEKDPSELPNWDDPDYNRCRDVLMTDLKPSLQINLKDVPAKFQPDHDLTWKDEYTSVNDTSPGVIDWRINAVPYFTAWENPVVQQILDGNNTFDPRQHIIKVDSARKWVYALIRVAQGTSHPIHLHGHDFYILGQSSEEFNPDTFVPQTVNPPRRDVAMVDGGGGYIAIAFETDNPGAWLLHCHIGWHTSEGMAMTFLEHEEQIKDLVDPGKLADQCGKWKTFAAAKGIKQHDSGV